MTANFIVLEPSKRGPQHITLIEAYLRALQSLDLPARGVELVYAADPTSFAALSDDVRAGLRHRPVDVIDAEARRWIAKGLLEVRVVRAAIRALGPGDVLLVTCLTAPALLMLELMNRMIGERRVIVVLHSEIEALFDPTLRSPRSWGFWAFRWSRLRRRNSRLQLAVIAGFIRDTLARGGEPALAADPLVLTFPCAGGDGLPETARPYRATFIGYKTRMKRFELFEETARRLSGPGLEFNVVCNGSVETVPTGARRPYDASGFIGEVAQSAVAVFPYDQGYAVSMSAAALDAMATGVHMLATRRGCFEAIARELGPDAITLFDTGEDLVRLLSDPAFLARAAGGKAERRARLAASSFGPAATRRDFAALLDRSGMTVVGMAA